MDNTIMTEQITKLLKLLVLVMLAGCIGWLLNFKLMSIADHCEILYVSQTELMQLEQDRMNQEKLEDRALFFEMPETAVKLATQLPKKYENRTTKVVYSIDKVMGKNVRSISKEVHQEIITELAKGGTVSNTNSDKGGADNGKSNK